MMRPTDDLYIRGTAPLIPPQALKAEMPMSPAANETVASARDAICDILSGEDGRLMAVVGPCSIHDEACALEYAERLAGLAERVADRVLVVMRVYFEKPRTTVGWKGLINDPFLDGSFDVQEGLRRARSILLRVNELGLPAATEMLDPITPQFLADLVAWASIGARTTESQTHRQMASGLSMPVGFKNGTDGNLLNAINAMSASRQPHSFLGIDAGGLTCVVHTKGNPWDHLILRGGSNGPNYGPEHIERASALLRKAGLRPTILVDCSHANSNKDYRRQPEVCRSVIDQRAAGNKGIVGLMLESNLFAGAQAIPEDASKLAYGISVTDGCIGWDDTEALLLEVHDRLGAAHATA